MNPPRLAIALLLAGALLTGACSDDTATPSDTASSSGPPATSVVAAPAVVTWAGQVCSGADQVRAAVDDLATAVPVEITTDQAVRDQVRTQVEQRADALRTDVQELGTSLKALPPEADPAVTQARDELERTAAAAQTQVDVMTEAAHALPDAATEDDLTAALKTLRSTVIDARTSLAAYASEIAQVLASTDDSVRSAFAAAPECQAIGGTPTS